MAQNTDDARRLVAAQSRLYSDAKVVFAFRATAVFLLAAITAVVAIGLPSLRTTIGVGGGAVVLVLSFVVANVEKWIRTRAAATQERFDTEIFQLPWNGIHADRPPLHIVATAARRYRGARDKNWYGDTEGVHRPFDVLICQATNLGWGVRMHLLWAWTLILITLVFIGATWTIWHASNLSTSDGLTAIVAPALGPLKEIAEQVRANFEAARTKESTERKLSELWDKGMAGPDIPSTDELRSIQDKILLLRQTNPYVPDWFDRVFHRSNEETMHTTTADRVTQAKRYGRADESPDH